MLFPFLRFSCLACALLLLTVPTIARAQDEPTPEEILELCNAELAAQVDAYQATVDETLATCIPEIQALLEAGDVAGAIQVSRQCQRDVLRAAGQTVRQMIVTTVRCIFDLRAAGGRDLIPELISSFRSSIGEVGEIQSAAIRLIEEATFPPGGDPPPAAVRFAERATAVINGFSNQYVRSAGSFTERAIAIIEIRLADGDTQGAARIAELAKRILARGAEQTTAIIDRICNFAAEQLTRWPNTEDLIAQLELTCAEATTAVESAESDACEAILLALAGGDDPPSEDPPSEDPPSEDPPSEDPPSEDPPQ